MSDVANLEIRVESKGVVTADGALHKMAGSAATSERATEALQASFRQLEATLQTSVRSLAAVVRQENAIDRASRAMNLGHDQAAAGATKQAGALDGLGGKLAKFGAVAALATGVVAGLRKTVEVTREFETLRAGLETATGSAEGAAQAFQALQEFGATTPYSLNQSVEAFTKLVNLGLTPSERALKSYGDTASAMGKDLMQMIEAVADASTGEFERLKEFGIKAKTQGDKVTFTFRGVATTVKKDAASIEEYLLRLGETNFAGAMDKRMATLDGKLSNLGDSWNKLFDQIGQSSVGDLIKAAVDLANDALTSLTDNLSSSGMNSAIAQLKDLGVTAGAALSKVTALFASMAGGDTFKNRVAGIEAVKKAQMEEIEIARMSADNEREWAAAMNDNAKDIKAAELAYSALQDKRKQGLVSKEAITKATDDIKRMRATSQDALDASWAIKHAEEKLADLRESAGKTFKKLVAGGATEKAAKGEIERQAKEAKAELEIAQNKYDQLINSATDRLGKFGKRGKTKEGPSKEAIEAEKKRKAEFDKLAEGLRDEETKIEESYAHRNEIIERYTKQDPEKRSNLLLASRKQYDEEKKAFDEKNTAEVRSLEESLRTQEESIQANYVKRIQLIQANVDEMDPLYEQLTAKATKQRDKELKDLADSKLKEREQLYQGLLTDEEQIALSYERQRKEILESTAVTETERAELMKRLRNQHNKELMALEIQRATEITQNSALLFENLANVAKNFGGEQSRTYKTMFAISKAFSVAQGALSIATGLARAQELPWPANLGAMIQVAATGAQIMAQISGANYSGAYDKGGKIPAGSVGIVGEYGPEFVQGPATVTSRKDTREMLARAAAPAAAPVQPIRIINTFDPATVKNYLSSSDGERVIMNQVQRNRNSNRRTA